MKIRIIVLAVLVTILASSVAFANPGVWVTNHALADWINRNDSGFTSNYITGFSAGQVNFRSLDQFVTNPGNYNMRALIIDNVNNNVLATLDFVIVAPFGGYTHTQTGNWSVTFPHPGWYRYELAANGMMIYNFHFIVR